jgi:chitodextrinase
MSKGRIAHRLGISRNRISWVLVVTAFISAAPVFGPRAAHSQTASDSSGFISNLITDPDAVLSEPSEPKPGYLSPVVPSPFETTITRIAGDPNTTLTTSIGGGTWGTDARHHYSKDQPWSSDNSLIAIQNSGSPSVLYLDGSTYKVKYGKCSSYSIGDDRWHPSPLHPHERINVKGNLLQWFDVVKCTQTKSITLPFSVNYFGNGEGNPSFDGRYAALADNTRMFVVDMENNKIGPAVDISSCGLSSCSVDWVSISPSGKYAVVSYTGDYPRVFDVNPTTLALTPRSLPSTAKECLSGHSPSKGFIYDLGHADMTLNPYDSNEDVLVGQYRGWCSSVPKDDNGKPVGQIVMVRLRDGKVTTLTSPSNSASVHHVSARSYDRPGWVYGGFYPAAGKRYSDELVAVKMDGSESVERLSNLRTVDSGCYRCEAHGVPSRDGRRAIFASNWGNSSGPVQDYVVDARASGTTTDTMPPSVTIASPASGAKISGTTTLAATATDNVGVTKVAFYSGTTLLGSASNSSGSTWQYSWDSTGTANGTYTLTARASDAAGNVTTSASVLVTVSNTAADTTPPSVSITSPTKGATVSGTIGLTVTATDNVGVTKVAFYDGSSLLGTATSSSGSTWQYSWNTSSAANGGCSLTAKAYDASGNCGTSASISVTVSNSTSDTTPPSTPANLKATASSSSQINLTWSASTDNVGVTGYNVYRNGTMLTKTTTASYSNTGLAASTSYTYTVAAVDAAGNVSSQSASASATTLSSSAQSQTLKFTPVGDAVIKSPYPSSNYGSDTKLWLQATPEYDSLIQFTVSGIGSAAVTSAKLYLYNFRSSTSGGKFYAAGSSWSESKVTWSNAPAAGTLIATLGTVPGSSWVAVDVTSLIKGDGTYSIRAVPAAGSVIGYYSKEMSGYVPYLMVTTGGGSSADTTSPSTPANLKTTAGSSSQIDLSWSASTDNVAVTGYNVYRDGSLLTKTSTTSFSDSGLTPSTSYSYTVAALDAAGNASGQCAPVSGTTLDAALNPVTLTFAPVADAHIQAAHPSSNYGSAAKVWVQASPEYDFLMKFAVSGIGTKKVTSAKLRLYCVHGDAAGGDFYSTGSGWTESGVTWNNAPSTGDLINTLGSAASSSWVEVDVASLITGDGTFSLRALPAAGTVVGYDSREAPGFAPELVVTAE